MDLKDIYWLAGILEGEGCFQVQGRTKVPRIVLRMRDQDVMEKVQLMFGCAMYLRKRSTYSLFNEQPIYTLVLCGHKAAGWMMTLYALMGARRRSKIKECLINWRGVKARPPLHMRNPIAQISRSELLWTAP